MALLFTYMWVPQVRCSRVFCAENAKTKLSFSPMSSPPHNSVRVGSHDEQVTCEVGGIKMRIGMGSAARGRFQRSTGLCIKAGRSVSGRSQQESFQRKTRDEVRNTKVQLGPISSGVLPKNQVASLHVGQECRVFTRNWKS